MVILVPPPAWERCTRKARSAGHAEVKRPISIILEVDCARARNPVSSHKTCLAFGISYIPSSMAVLHIVLFSCFLMTLAVETSMRISKPWQLILFTVRRTFSAIQVPGLSTVPCRSDLQSWVDDKC